MSEYIHMRRGDCEKRKEVLELLDTSFSFKMQDFSFEKLLPKLYKEEYKPAENNIVLDVNGEMRAAVGLYYNNITVCGETLKAGGIGNVACHPDYRENGYMRFCMAYCLDEMKQNMTDFAFLSGARQRYERYSFEPAGIRYRFFFNKNNVTRKHGKDKKSLFTAKLIKENDSEILSRIADIYSLREYKAERPKEKMYDILVSWQCKPYAVFGGDIFKGWFVLEPDGKKVTELFCENDGDIEETVICALETSGENEISFDVPPFEKELMKYLAENCEYYEINNPDQYTIFSYENVIRAFLKLKSTYQTLSDGECVLLIEGLKLPEQIKITVRDNEVTVSETDEKPDMALNHREAMMLVGSLYSEKRNKLKGECASWFPLPLFTYEQDNV